MSDKGAGVSESAQDFLNAKRPHFPDPFKFCPSCGKAAGPGGLSFEDGKMWRCQACGFRYFHNVATASGLILDWRGEIVFVERAQEPRKGKLGLPGGFVNPRERAEDGALRECREEIGWAPPALRFLASFPNSYTYADVVYDTCDFYFYYRFAPTQQLPAFSPGDGEAARIRRLPLDGIMESQLAFPSLVLAIRAYKASL